MDDKKRKISFPHGANGKKNLPANAEVAGSIFGSRRSPGEGNDNPSSILACEIPWTEEPGGLQFMASQKGWTSLSD